MYIENQQMGKIFYKKEDIIYFKDGLYGFENSKSFIIIKKNDNHHFKFLQSIDNPNLTLIIINPKCVFKDYILCLSDNELKEIDLIENKYIEDYVIVTIPNDIEEISVNLVGPIVINKQKKIAKQMISQNQEYSVKHFIFDNLKISKMKKTS